MGRVVSIRGKSFGSKEWDLLSFFLQNAKTVCLRLSVELEKNTALQEYARLLHSLGNSLDHAWQVAKSYADKDSADWEEIQKLIVNIDRFATSSRALSKIERSEITEEVTKLKIDLKDTDVEDAKLQQVVLGAETQWKKVVSLVANNLGPYRKDLGEHFKILEDLSARFDQDFAALMEEQKAMKAQTAKDLHEFLSGIQDHLMALKEEALARDLGYAA